MKQCPDNYDMYIQHERNIERQYEHYKKMWLEGYLPDEEYEKIKKEYEGCEDSIIWNLLF